MKLASVVAISLLVSSNSFAERLMPMTFKGQPLIILEKGSPVECGIRMMGIQGAANVNNPQEALLVADGSFLLDKGGYGLVKALASQSSVGEVLKHEMPKPRPLKGFWLKAEGVKATTPYKNKVLDGDGKYSRLYVSDAKSVLALYSSVRHNKPIQFALNFDKDAEDVAFFGTVNLNEAELQQVDSCMNELISLMEKESKGLQ